MAVGSGRGKARRGLSSVSPRLFRVDGRKEWRLGGPAGPLHRIGGPAYEEADGYKAWLENGLLHRADGPAIEYTNGGMAWYSHGKLHRVDGPAAENVGDQDAWYVNGQKHRLDGPAIEWYNGDKEWWVDGKRIEEKEFASNILIKRLEGISLDAPGKVTF